MKTLRQLVIFTVFSVMLFVAINAYATPPIGSGQTIEFLNTTGFDIGVSADHVYDVATGDFDNDGYLDVVSVNRSGAVTVWQNDGTPFAGGTWTPNNAGTSSTYLWAVTTGDLDGDGWLDIVIGAGSPENNEIIVWQNSGTPFTGAWTQQDVGTVNHGFSVSVADLDNDGDLDIVSSNQDSSYEIYAWQNNGAFVNAWTGNGVASLGGSYSVWDATVGDLDNDGYIDIIAQDNIGGNGFSVYRNNGTPFTGTWARNAAGSLSSNVGGVDVGDVDNDGDLDVIYGRNIDISVYENNGSPFSGNWPINTVGSVAGAIERGLVFVDLDNDGDLDIVTGTGSGEDYEVIAWQNDGTPHSGTWLQRDIGVVADSVRGIAVGDLDNDGDADIVSGNGSSAAFEVMGWENKAVHRNAPFPAAYKTTIDAGFNNAFGVVSADIDGDGDMDIIAAAESADDIAWWNNTAGDGSAWTKTDVDTSFDGPHSVAVADINGDGDMDVIGAANNANDIAWWDNTAGDGTVWTKTDVDINFTGAYKVIAADMDGDGDMDILGAALNNTSADDIRWWENTVGDGSAWVQVTVSTGTLFRGADGVDAADLDGDGDLDIVGVSSYDDKVSWWENTAGDGSTWSLEQSVSAVIFNTGRSVVTADMDRDGDMDIIGAARQSDHVIWWENTSGDGSTWGRNEVDLNSDGAESVFVADVDGDGDPDILGSEYAAGDVVWWENTAGDASVWVKTVVDGAVGSTADVTAADLDGDGDLEIIATSYGANDVMWWRNGGGNAGFAVSDTSISTGHIENGVEDDVMKVIFTHNGIAVDRDLELSSWGVELLEETCTTPISDADANLYLAALRVRLDDGDDTFQNDGTDVEVGIISSPAFVGVGGVHTIIFANDDANVQVSGASSATYWLSFEAATGSNQLGICARIDPDAHMMVEGKTPDFSVIVEDSEPTTTTNTPTAVSLQSFNTTSNTVMIPLLIATFLLVLVGGVALRRRAG